MKLQQPFNLQQWIEEHRELLKPPVGNQQVYVQNDDFIVMVVGGPNSRKDYHYNEGEELFYQLEGDIVLKIINKEGEPQDISINAGDMFLLPPKVPHSPQRSANSIGLVIERYRSTQEKDGFMWFCEQCNHKLYDTYFELTDIVTQLPKVMQHFYDSKELRTCSKCNTVMEKP